MEVQVSLKKEAVEPWSGVCSQSCWYAAKDRCTCRCGGRYHGQGNKKTFESKVRDQFREIGRLFDEANEVNQIE